MGARETWSARVPAAASTRSVPSSLGTAMTARVGSRSLGRVPGDLLGGLPAPREQLLRQQVGRAQPSPLFLHLGVYP